MGKKKFKEKKQKFFKCQEISQKKREKRKKKKNKKKALIQREREYLEKEYLDKPFIPEDIQEYINLLYEGEEEMNKDEFDVFKLPSTKEENKKYLNDLINISDLLLEIVDCRFINQTRIPELENKIVKQMNKKLILILNKSDLIIENDLKNTIQKLKDENIFEDIIFNSSFIRESINSLITNLDLNDKNNTIKSNAKKSQNKKYMKIGIFGYPNMGKSFLLNSIKLIDGMDMTKKFIMFSNDKKKLGINSIFGTYFNDNEDNFLFYPKTEKDYDQLKNPKKYIEKIFQYISLDSLNKIYNITLKNENIDELIEKIKVKYNYDDMKKPAIHILRDISSGKINFQITE